MNADIMQNLMYSLEIMWKGMAGIFTVTIIIALIVLLLSKLDSKQTEDNKK